MAGVNSDYMIPSIDQSSQLEKQLGQTSKRRVCFPNHEEEQKPYYLRPRFNLQSSSALSFIDRPNYVRQDVQWRGTKRELLPLGVGAAISDLRSVSYSFEEDVSSSIARHDISLRSGLPVEWIRLHRLRVGGWKVEQTHA
nr:hypothetical protein Q903MT_gene1338 [Picea sitchensis]